MASKKAKKASEIDQTGLDKVDALHAAAEPSLDDYLAAVSQYVREEPTLPGTPEEVRSIKKACQIRLSHGLAKALVAGLKKRLPELNARAGEHDIAVAQRKSLVFAWVCDR